MVTRNVYNEAENKAIAEFMDSRDKYVGWVKDDASDICPYPVVHRVATKELMVQMADAVDKKNPLWRDEKYASQTRWGEIIAFPIFPQRITHGGGGMIALKAPPDIFVDRWFPGTYWEFFAPIHAGDSFHVWRDRPRLIDMTELDGKGPRKFRIMSCDIKYINQKDEVVARFQRFFDETWYPMKDKQPPRLFQRYPTLMTEPTNKNVKKAALLPGQDDLNAKPAVKSAAAPDYVYTKEEMDYIRRISNEEEVRGAKIRFWEDIKVGDDLKPVILGPYTLQELAIDFASTAGPLHIPHPGMPGSDPKGFIGSPSCESFMARLLTNWMGDDGVIRKFRWVMMEHAHLGDTIMAHGRVTNKYVEKGKFLVDLLLWSELIGEEQIEHAVSATVELLPREEYDPNDKVGLKKNQKAQNSVKPGDRIRIKDRSDWPSLPGYRLAGAEGTVTKIWEQDEPPGSEVFSEFVEVKIEKTKSDIDISFPYNVKVEFLEKI